MHNSRYSSPYPSLKIALASTLLIIVLVMKKKNFSSFPTTFSLQPTLEEIPTCHLSPLREFRNAYFSSRSPPTTCSSQRGGKTEWEIRVPHSLGMSGKQALLSFSDLPTHIPGFSCLEGKVMRQGLPSWGGNPPLSPYVTDNQVFERPEAQATGSIMGLQGFCAGRSRSKLRSGVGVRGTTLASSQC